MFIEPTKCGEQMIEEFLEEHREIRLYKVRLNDKGIDFVIDNKRKMICPACDYLNKEPTTFEYTPTTLDKLRIFDEKRIYCCNSCGFGMIETDVAEEELMMTLNHYSLHSYRDRVMSFITKITQQQPSAFTMRVCAEFLSDILNEYKIKKNIK